MTSVNEDNLSIEKVFKAVEDGDAQLCKLFIERAENTNPLNDEGSSLLHIAAKCGRVDIFQLIMKSFKRCIHERIRFVLVYDTHRYLVLCSDHSTHPGLRG